MKMEMVTATANPTQIQSRYNCSDSDFLIKQKIIVKSISNFQKGAYVLLSSLYLY